MSIVNSNVWSEAKEEINRNATDANRVTEIVKDVGVNVALSLSSCMMNYIPITLDYGTSPKGNTEMVYQLPTPQKGSYANFVFIRADHRDGGSAQYDVTVCMDATDGAESSFGVVIGIGTYARSFKISYSASNNTLTFNVREEVGVSEYIDTTPLLLIATISN